MASVRLKSWAEIGSRVATARTRAGFTQQHVAERLGLHRSAIARIELGQRQLDALELAQLADLLGRPVSWFLTRPPAAIASHRSDLSASQDVERLEDELELTARDVELLAEVGALQLPVEPLPEGVTSLDSAEAGATTARSRLGRGDGPLPDLQSAVERFGLLAFSFDLGPDTVDGGYVRVGDLGVALVNGAVDSGRRRFNLAHELGHHLLADEYTVDFGIGTSRADREALINAFAVHFLMPRSSLRRRWDELASDWEEPRSRLIVLAAEYRVSWSALVSHALTLQLVSRNEFELLGARRPTRADYLELGVSTAQELSPIALAPSYGRAVLRAFRRSVISPERTLELLRGTITADDLPQPHDIPLEALAPDFEDLG